MGVSVSHPLRRPSKGKYIQTLDGEWDALDESEHFLSQSSQQGNNGETLRRGKGCSKRNEPGFFQFKGVRGSSRRTFDSLDTIDSRKSVPFAVLPENNTQASASSPDSTGFMSILSDGETITAEKSSKVLYTDYAEGDLEDGSSASKCAGKLKEKNVCRHAEHVHQKVIAPLQGKFGRKDLVSSSTRSGEDAHLPDGNYDNIHSRGVAGNARASVLLPAVTRADGRENERESELEKARMVRADSETGMVRPSNRYKLGPHHSTSEKFS